MNEFELLKMRFEEQRALFQRCVTEARSLWWVSRVLVQAWLAEIAVTLGQLEQQIAQLQGADGGVPPQSGLRSAWRRYFDVLAALSAAAAINATAGGPPQAASTDTDTTEPDRRPDIASVARRLLFVFAFLLVQIAGAIGLLTYTVRMFAEHDPATAMSRAQWDARGPARVDLERLRGRIQRLADAQKAAAPGEPGGEKPAACPTGCSPDLTPPDITALRSEIEALQATLPDRGFSERDLKLFGSWINAALGTLDEDSPDLNGALGVLKAFLRVSSMPARQTRRHHG